MSGVAMLLPIHIAAGGLAMLLGAVALLAPKGMTLHRRVGLLFVASMIVMGLSGSVLAARINITNISVMGGFMSAYFVITAFTTVRRPSAWTRRLNGVAFAMGGAVALVWLGLGMKGLVNPSPGAQAYMVATAFFLGGVVLAALIGDLRTARSAALRGGPRLARHLWRMCFALFIAVGSFVAIPERVAKILPDVFAAGPMRPLPVVLVFAAMFYWLWRVRVRGIVPRREASGRTAAV